jgi:hypothetical protein
LSPVRASHTAHNNSNRSNKYTITMDKLSGIYILNRAYMRYILFYADRVRLQCCCFGLALNLRRPHIISRWRTTSSLWAMQKDAVATYNKHMKMSSKSRP